MKRSGLVGVRSGVWGHPLGYSEVGRYGMRNSQRADLEKANNSTVKNYRKMCFLNLNFYIVDHIFFPTNMLLPENMKH